MHREDAGLDDEGRQLHWIYDEGMEGLYGTKTLVRYTEGHTYILDQQPWTDRNAVMLARKEYKRTQTGRLSKGMPEINSQEFHNLWLEAMSQQTIGQNMTATGMRHAQELQKHKENVVTDAMLQLDFSELENRITAQIFPLTDKDLYK